VWFQPSCFGLEEERGGNWKAAGGPYRRSTVQLGIADAMAKKIILKPALDGGVPSKDFGRNGRSVEKGGRRGR